MRFPYGSLSAQRNCQTSGPRLRALLIRLPCCIPASRVAVATWEEFLRMRHKIRPSRRGPSELLCGGNVVSLHDQTMITSGLPVIPPEPMPSAEITSHEPTCRYLYRSAVRSEGSAWGEKRCRGRNREESRHPATGADPWPKITGDRNPKTISGVTTPRHGTRLFKRPRRVP
jgi:hypothetical protein